MVSLPSDGRPDDVVAAEAWQRHQQRNRSVIVDTCQGQLKSRVVCPDCKRESVTFDPFTFISVPIPSIADKIIAVTAAFCELDENKTAQPPVKYGVRVAQTGCVRDLKIGLSKLNGFDPNAMLVVYVDGNKIAAVRAVASLALGVEPCN